MPQSITLLKPHFFANGGAEKYAQVLADAFHKRGCDVTVLTTGPVAQVAQEKPYSILSHPLQRKTSVGKLWEFEKFCTSTLKKKPTDIVLGLERNRSQTHLRASAGVHKSYLAKRRHFEPIFKSCRHKFNPLHISLLYFEKIGFESSQLQTLFVNSHMVKREVLSHYSVDKDKIQVIHNGVDWVRYENNFSPISATKDRLEFLFIGNGFSRKGLRPLLLGLQALKTRDFHLTVVGQDTQAKAFNHFAKSLGLEKQITFAGSHPDTTVFLQKADCLVIPSYYDPFANVTVEALAMGLFVISSKHNGGSEVLTNKSGTIIEELSAEGIKAALEVAFSRPKTQESALEIRNSVEHLDFSTQLNRYIALCLSPTS